MIQNTSFKDQILKSLASADTFKANSRFVRDELMKQDKETINVFLDTIEQVIQDPKYSPEAKFYNLFYLKQTTEHNIPQLIIQLATRKNLFKILEQQASFDSNKSFPEKGSTFFTPNPTKKDSLSGSNYLALLLEIIKFWSQKYGTGDKSKENPFTILYKRLSQGHNVQFPKNFHFYKTKDQKPGPHGEANDIAISKGDNRLQQRQNLGLETPQPRTEDGKNSNIRDSKRSGKSDLKIATEKVMTIRAIFEGLSSLYEGNKTESSDLKQMMPIYYEELFNVRKPLEQIIEKFALSSSKENEQILAAMLVLNEKISELEENLKEYNNNQTGYDEHRLIALQLIEIAKEIVSAETIGKDELPDQRDPLMIPNVAADDPNEGVGMNKGQANTIRVNEVRKKMSKDGQPRSLDEITDEKTQQNLPISKDLRLGENYFQTAMAGGIASDKQMQLKNDAGIVRDKHEEEGREGPRIEKQLNQDEKKTDEQSARARELEIQHDQLKEKQLSKEEEERQRVIKERFKNEGPKLDPIKQTSMVNPINLQEPSFEDIEKEDSLKTRGNMGLVAKVDLVNSQTRPGQNKKSSQVTKPGSSAAEEEKKMPESKIKGSMAQAGKSAINQKKEGKSVNRPRDDEGAEFDEQTSMTDPVTQLPREFYKIDPNPPFKIPEKHLEKNQPNGPKASVNQPLQSKAQDIGTQGLGTEGQIRLDKEEDSIRDQPSMSDPVTHQPRESLKADANPSFKFGEIVHDPKKDAEVIAANGIKRDAFNAGAANGHGKEDSHPESQKVVVQERGKITAHDFKLEHTAHPPNKNLQDVDGDELNELPSDENIMKGSSHKGTEKNQPSADQKLHKVRNAKRDYTIEELLKMEFNTDEEPAEDHKRDSIKLDRPKLSGPKKDKPHQRPDPMKIVELEKEEESEKEDSKKPEMIINITKPTTQADANRPGSNIQDHQATAKNQPLVKELTKQDGQNLQQEKSDDTNRISSKIQGPSRFGAKPESFKPGRNEAGRTDQPVQKDNISKQEEVIAQKPESADIKSAKEIINTLHNIFEGLFILYEHNKTESIDFEQTSPVYYEELFNSHKLFEEKIQRFASNSTQENEKILSDMLGLNEKISGLKANYKKYQSKKGTFEEHRTLALQLLTPAFALSKEDRKDNKETFKTPNGQTEDHLQKTDAKKLPSSSIKSNDLTKKQSYEEIKGEGSENNSQGIKSLKIGGNKLQESNDLRFQGSSAKNLKSDRKDGFEEDVENQRVSEDPSISDSVKQLPRDSYKKEPGPSFKFSGRVDGNKFPVEDNKEKISELKVLKKDFLKDESPAQVDSGAGINPDKDSIGNRIEGLQQKNDLQKIGLAGEKQTEPTKDDARNKLGLGHQYEETRQEPKGSELIGESSKVDQKTNQHKPESQSLQMSLAPKTLSEKNKAPSKTVKDEYASPLKELGLDFKVPESMPGDKQRGSTRPRIWDEPKENKIPAGFETPNDDPRLQKARNLNPRPVNTKASEINEDSDIQIQALEISPQRSQEINEQRSTVRNRSPPKLLASQQIIHASDLLDDVDDPKQEKQDLVFYPIVEEQEEHYQNHQDFEKLGNKPSDSKKDVYQETTISMHKKRPHDESNRMLQSMNPRLVYSKQQPDEPKDRATKSMTESEKGMKRKSIRLADEISWIGKSIKLSRNRSKDLKTSQNKLNQASFFGKSVTKSDFLHKFLAEPNVLSHFETELHLLKNENESLRNSVVVSSSSPAKDDNLKLVVVNLQKQLVDYQREFEILKNQNSVLEAQPIESVDESLLLKLQRSEAENLSLKNKLNRITKEKSLRTEGKTLHEIAKELQEENDELSNILEDLKKDQLSLTLKLSELEEPSKELVSHIHNDSVDSRRVKEKSPLNRHSSSKTEHANQKGAANGASNSQVFHNFQTPQGSNDFDWFVNNPNPLHYDANLKNTKIHYGFVEQGKYYSRNYRTTMKNEMRSSERQKAGEESGESHQHSLKSSSTSAKVEAGTAVLGSIPRNDGIISYQLDRKNDRSHYEGYQYTSPYRVKSYEGSNHSSKKLSESMNHFSPESFTKNSEAGITPKRNNYAYDLVEIGPQSNGKREYGHSREHRSLRGEKEYLTAPYTQKTSGHVSYDILQRHSIISDVEEELRDRLHRIPSLNAVLYFKLSCLSSKSLIFENEFIRVGISSMFAQSQLKIILFFDNKTDELISDFTARVSQDTNLEALMKPVSIDPMIVRGRQTKQMILVAMKKIPFSCLEMHCQGFSGTQKVKFDFLIPTMVNKFMEFKYTDNKEFHEIWRRHSRNILKSEPIHLDHSIVRDVGDFKKYFANLLELKAEFGGDDFMSDKRDINFGVIFELGELGSEYALKIHYSHPHQVTFELATSLLSFENAKFIMQHLNFLFKQ